MSKPVNSQTLVHRVTQSRFAASKKHLSEKLTRGSAGIRHQDVSSTMVKEVPCTQNSEFVKAAAGGETEIDPEVSVKGSGSKLDGTGLRAEVEVLASREPADCNVFVNPKHLNFDDVEESCRNGSYTPAFKEGMQGRSSEKRSISLMDADDILEEGMTVDYQENHNSSLPMKFLGNPEVSVKGKDLLSGLSGSPAEEDRSISNGNAISSVKETSDVHNDAVANMLLESGNRESRCGTMGSVEHSPKAILESQGLSLSRVDVATSIVSRSPVEETPQNEDRDMIESSESSPKAQIKEGEYSDELNVVKPPDASPCEVEEGKIGEFQSKERGLVLSSGRITKSRSDQQESSLNVSGSASNARRTGSVGVSPRLSNPANQPSELVNYSHITNDCFQKKEAKARDHFITEGSCPQHKRRKIECKTTDDQSASLGLREQGFYNVSRDSMCGKLGSVEDSPKAVLESQGLSISREDVVKSIVSRSSVEETHQNEDHHMIEWSESSPKAQMTEGRISLGCRDTSGSAPFIFMDKEFEASILSLMKQTGMMEETGLAHPPSIIIDSGSQCMVETTVSLTRKDNLTTGNAEHLTCAGRAMQEMRFDLGVGSPHGQSLDLIGSDDRKPELEGFVMQTDDEPTSIAGKGISFDEWNLPSTTIERASILEHLCQSTCMQTPVVCSSASNKLHKIPNLYQSVPIGLLEGVDMRTMNDVVKQLKDGYSYLNEEVGQAFYGRSYSDCLLNHSGQSGWDTKKPYLSPVGKLWDTTGSGTSSSTKRGSLILELPCISEENENADEAADTFQDESVTDALNRSIQRVPLADITEIPNPPASVSKAEPYADRLSLDSMNTEFSLTGTHKNFKRKLGIQSSSKRRYNNKENLSMSRGTNDIKRTTGSLHNRFNKPKLSGKTSLRKGGPSLSEQEPKRNNIVSSMTSFIPLVQQKQAAAVVTGKRDVKVKALEAAEAAKRQAEKKENERKMKKEALKLERSRMEQENIKQLELQKKKKEEERKKKEADMASKKRQREEEERKEKERKRMRIEARRNKREHEDKVPAEKDGRGPGGKEYKDEMASKKMEEEKGYDNNRNISENKPSTSRISISNAGKESIVHEEFHEASSNYGYKAEVLSNSDRAMKNSVAITSQEQSYDISPYKESDDENDDDDSIIPNNKFIPSWSSKNCLAFAASSQNRADPETIFPLESFCCISEVLLPRKHQLNNSGMC
ncbi:uncharacterized protein LOC103965127 [Pyrus x bretschneideri]|uniref:uncharacterized protein LOC103965127 n=1 Tax=Pyrus x bretschneideri TaxID=225117 RepID=UPI00202F72FD|nr:uncharacterized protein LOC103965127 [Pyrus x bretschneideri]